MSAKLTSAQRRLLAEIANGPQTVAPSYFPARRLVGLGLATAEPAKWDKTRLAITDDGRAALAAERDQT